MSPLLSPTSDPAHSGSSSSSTNATATTTSPPTSAALVPTADKSLDYKELFRQSDANIGNTAPVARIMKMALPDNAKIAKEAKECMQECVSEFISFITSEGMCLYVAACLLLSNGTKLNFELRLASEKCQQEKRKTVNGEDILFAMGSLGFENYAEALKIYLTRYREVCK